MLILTRKIDQSIIINGDIVIKILGMERDRVKLGIDAPKNVSVFSEELTFEPRNAGIIGSLMLLNPLTRAVRQRIMS